MDLILTNLETGNLGWRELAGALTDLEQFLAEGFPHREAGAEAEPAPTRSVSSTPW